MSVPMKTRRIRNEVSIQMGNRKPRLFLVPKGQAQSVIKLLAEFEVDEETSVSWREPVLDLLGAYSEPGAALRGARAKEGITQTALAVALGIPQSNISEMESGKRPIGKNMAHRLAKALKLNYRVFL